MTYFMSLMLRTFLSISCGSTDEEICRQYEDNHICSECDYEAMKEGDLEKHQGTKHQSKETDELLIGNKCNMCDYQTSDESLLNTCVS